MWAVHRNGTEGRAPEGDGGCAKGGEQGNARSTEEIKEDKEGRKGATGRGETEGRGGGDYFKQARQLANKVVNAIRQLQGVVADGRAAWSKASGPERARRAEENVWKYMRSGEIWQWRQAGIMEEHRRTRIARAQRQ